MTNQADEPYENSLLYNRALANASVSVSIATAARRNPNQARLRAAAIRRLTDSRFLWQKLLYKDLHRRGDKVSGGCCSLMAFVVVRRLTDARAVIFEALQSKNGSCDG